MSQVVPRLTMPSDGQIAGVRARSLEILASAGVRVPAELVDRALRAAPSEIAVHEAWIRRSRG